MTLSNYGNHIIKETFLQSYFFQENLSNCRNLDLFHPIKYVLHGWLFKFKP